MLGCCTGSSRKELVSHPDCTMPGSLIIPPSARSFSLLPWKERSQRTKVPFSGMSTHGVSSREPCPSHLFSCSFLLWKFPPGKPVRFHGLPLRPWCMAGGEPERIHLAQQSFPASVLKPPVLGQSLSSDKKDFMFRAGGSWPREGRGSTSGGLQPPTPTPAEGCRGCVGTPGLFLFLVGGDPVLGLKVS